MAGRSTSGARANPAPERDDGIEAPFEAEVHRRQELLRVSGERRFRFETIALGAPITAAFVGILAAEHGGVFAEASSAAAEVFGTRGGSAGTRTAYDGDGSFGDDPEALPSPEAGIPATAAADGTTGGLWSARPVDGGLGQVMSQDGSGSGVPPPAGASEGVAATSAVMSGPEINFTFGGLQAPYLGDSLALTGNGTGTSLDPIGRYVIGTDGDDLIFGTDRADYLAGGAGNDEIHGLAGNDTLDGGTGDDLLYGDEGDDLLLGGPGRDRLYGGTGNDDLRGGPGDDRLFGQDGRDALAGGLGDDILDGGAGADNLRQSIGFGGDEFVVDDIGDIARDGGARRPEFDGDGDLLRVSEGFADSLQQVHGVPDATFVFTDVEGKLPEGIAGHLRQVGPGIDHVVLEGAADFDVVGDASANRITGNAGDNMLFGGVGDDILKGGAGADVFDGGAGADELRGDAGDDILFGGGGGDDIFGGGGNDVLGGGAGADRLFGGAGDDTYAIGLSEGGVDTIFDHEGVNQIRLDGTEGHNVEAALAGDDLFVLADDNAVAVVEDYRGNEEAFAGIDLGAGVVPIEDLLVATSDDGIAGDDRPAGSDEPTSGDDLLEDFLPGAPTLVGDDGVDELMGTAEADWLSGLAGDDHLRGGDGNDVLEGGAGNDTLEGGAGDDRYLFRPDDIGDNSIIRDAEGTNVADLQGFAGIELRGVASGGDLVVVASNNFLFTVEDYVGNEGGFAGVQVGDRLISTEEMLAGVQVPPAEELFA